MVEVEEGRHGILAGEDVREGEDLLLFTCEEACEAGFGLPRDEDLAGDAAELDDPWCWEGESPDLETQLQGERLEAHYCCLREGEGGQGCF